MTTLTGETEDGRTREPILTSFSPPEPISQTPCAICQRQFSKYTCARCNIPYCSLTCYRSEKHAECSESFYRREVESDIRTAPSKTKEEREQMMELLRRFEQEDAEQSSNMKDGADEDEDDLVSRLDGISLDSASYDEVWNLLTPAERQRFAQALRDPNGDLAKQLLSSEVMKQELVEPWWMSSSESTLLSATRGSTANLQSSSSIGSKHYGRRPAPVNVPSSLRQGATMEGALHLVHNMVYISIAYAYVTRRMLLSPLASSNGDDSDSAEACRMISDLIPLLIDRQSQVRHETVSSVITDVYARLEEDTRTSSLLALLLEDASRLLYPSVVEEVNEDEATFSGSCKNLFLCLSDLHDLFSRQAMVPPSSGLKLNSTKRHIAAAHKLLFYSAHAAIIPAAVWQGLSHQLLLRAEKEARRK